MPSLIYVARVTPLPSRLIEHLQAAGFHVESFGPGQITTDACLMVITPAALPAGLGPVDSAAAAAPVTGSAPDTTCRPEDVPPLPGLEPHLGSQPTLWNSVREFALKGSSGRSASAALARAPRSAEEVRVHRRWPSLAAAMALMFLAGVLLTRRASTFESPSTDNAGLTNRSGRSGSDLPNSAQGSPLSSMGALKGPAATQRRFSDNDFVAQDFTTHFDLRSPGVASPQSPELRRRVQSSLKPKRIVVD